MSMNIALKMTFYLGSENGMCHTGKGAGGGGGGGGVGARLLQLH